MTTLLDDNLLILTNLKKNKNILVSSPDPPIENLYLFKDLIFSIVLQISVICNEKNAAGSSGLLH